MLRRFFTNPDTGELAIFQVPNLPLVVFFVAAFVRRVFQPHGAVGTAVSVVAGLSLAWWSVDEIARGDSPFRRVLGGLVLIAMIAGLLLR
ncbi:MAG: hypothetical protein QOF60_1867 [Actinomycetota bacterium]|nr:hypothetical protein [Actinomycetota bacterium]